MYQELIEKPSLAVAWYLMSVYLYRDSDEQVLTDEAFDGLCFFLRNNWDVIEHRDKHLIDKNGLNCMTTVGCDIDTFPVKIKGAAHRWLETHQRSKDIAMLKIGDDFTIEYTGAGWTLSHFRDGEPTEKNPNPARSCRKMHYASLEQCAMRAADLDAIAITTADEIASEMAITRRMIIDAIYEVKAEDAEHIKTKRVDEKVKKKKPPVRGVLEVTLPVEPKHIMTPLATCTYERYIAANWTDAQLIEHGLMIDPAL